MELWWTALLLGVASSLHCTVMCGPLVAVVGGSTPFSQFVYHTGRVLVYSIMGLFFGFMGKSLLFAGIQNHLSVLAGIVILLIVFIPERYYLSSKWAHRLSQWKQRIVHHSPLSGLARRGLFGVANGLVPCPMVYVALALALAAGDVGDSVLLMVLFGLGTIPLLMGSYLLFYTMRWPAPLIQLKPVFVALLGIWLLVRGANMELPYLVKPLGWYHTPSDAAQCK